MTTPQQLLNIDDALVSESNPARTDGSLDVERCARLHNYLVAYAWMAYHQRNNTQDLEELLKRPSFFQQYPDAADLSLDRLDDSLISYLERIIMPDLGFYYWVEGVAMIPADESFFLEDENENAKKERFVILYGTRVEFGSHTLGLIYDQQRHRATMTLVLEYTDYVNPVHEHEEMWFPLETILSHWIYMTRIGKVSAGPEGNWGERGANVTQLGPWIWHPYSDAQVDSAVAAMDRLSAAIEARMSYLGLLSVDDGDGDGMHSSKPLLTHADLDAASVPDNCFIRSFLTRIKTPRFKYIAPGLEVPHDSQAFVARQKFTRLPPSNEDDEFGSIIPSVLIFAATDKPVGFNKEIRRTFVTPNDRASNKLYAENHPIPTGLYSERVDRGALDIAEEGFRLLLPFKLRPDFRENIPGPKTSVGGLVNPESLTELFQHGPFYPFGGEWRAQRLERVLDRWRELVESGVWMVGPDGVQGGIEKFLDAAGAGWRDYWISPGW